MIRRAFTLIEVVTVVVILGLLSAIAVPVYLDYRHDAEVAAEEAIVGRIKVAIQSAGMRNAIDDVPHFPIDLDDAAANSLSANDNPFFEHVLGVPVTYGWRKGGAADKYISLLENAYTYDNVKGTFSTSAETDDTTSGDGGDTTTDPGALPDLGDDGALTREDVQALRGSDIIDANLTPEQISWLTDEQLATLTPDELASLTQEQIEALTADQITALDYEQFEAIANSLTPEQISQATPQQIAMLTQEAFDSLSAEQRAALTQAQLDEIAYAEDIRSRSWRDIRNLTAYDMKYLSPEQIAAIPNNYEMSRIPAELRDAFTKRQIQALDTSEVSIGYLNDAQRELLTTEQIESLGSYRDIRYVPESRAAEVTAELISTIPNSYEMSRIPEEVRAAFTESQVQAINTADVSISYLTEAQREALTTGQIESLGRYTDIRYVPASRATEVSNDLIASIPDSYQMSRIPDEVRAAFTESQVQSINTTDVSISYLTEAQREQLTTSQIESMGRYSDIRYVPADRAAEVSTDLIARIPSSYEMERIPGEVRAAFTETQVQAVNTADVSISHLTEAQREQLTTAQIESLGTFRDLRYLPSDRATEVTAELISTIPSSYEMSRIPDEVRAAFTETQVQSLNTTGVSISYLTEAQREQLTTAQVESLGSFRDLRYLPSDRAAQVTTELISTIPSSYEMSRIPTEVRAAFTETQVQAIDTAEVSIGYLTSSQREQLTSSQIASIGEYQDLRYVPASSVASVTTSLIASIPSTYEFSRIPTETVQALTQEQVLAISSDIYDSIKDRLTEEQQSWRP